MSFCNSSCDTIWELGILIYQGVKLERGEKIGLNEVFNFSFLSIHTIAIIV